MIGSNKVILIGGSPMVGKTTLAAQIASKYGYGCISTDDIGEILQTVVEINPMKGFDYREYYLKKSSEELVKDALYYHEKIWPTVKRLVEIHTAWSSAIIIEGWALYPKFINTLKAQNVKSIWLIADNDLLESRVFNAADFYKGASDEKGMIRKYLERSKWHNQTLLDQVLGTNSRYVRVTKNSSVEELVKEAICILA